MAADSNAADDAEAQKPETFEMEQSKKKEGDGGAGLAGSCIKKQHLDWAGQMAASLFWTISVFVYGIEGTGDILQLCAALSWFVANLAALLPESG